MAGVFGRSQEVISKFVREDLEAGESLSDHDARKSHGEEERRQGNRKREKQYKKGGFDAKR